VFGDCPEIINAQDLPDVVNVTYSYNYESFYYDINITSSGQDILNMHGIVMHGIAASAAKADSMADRLHSVEMTNSMEPSWRSYADYARGIGEAVKRDLFKTVKTADVVPAPAQDSLKP
jgi:hypothetical protein